jgi:hypothetical protein
MLLYTKKAINVLCFARQMSADCRESVRPVLNAETASRISLKIYLNQIDKQIKQRLFGIRWARSWRWHKRRRWGLELIFWQQPRFL